MQYCLCKLQICDLQLTVWVCGTAGKEGQLAAGSFDSLSAVELTNGLNFILDLKLPGTLVFDYPSVNAIAGYIHSQLADKDTNTELPALPVSIATGLAGSTAVVKVRYVTCHCICRVCTKQAGAQAQVHDMSC